MKFSRIHLVHTGAATGTAHIRLITEGCNRPIRGCGRGRKAVYEELLCAAPVPRRGWCAWCSACLCWLLFESVLNFHTHGHKQAASVGGTPAGEPPLAAHVA